MQDRRRRFGIESKIVRSILLAGIAPMVLALLGGYLVARAVRGPSAGKELQSMAANTANAVTLVLRQRTRETEDIAVSTALRRALQEDAEGKTSEWVKDLNESLIGLCQRSRSEQRQIIVLTPHGKLFAASSRPDKTDFSDEPWWQSIINNKRTIFSLAKVDPQADLYLARICAPILAMERTELLGAVCDTFDLRNLFVPLFPPQKEVLAETLFIVPSPSGALRAITWNQEEDTITWDEVPARLAETFAAHGTDWTRQKDAASGESYVIGFAPIDLRGAVGADVGSRTYYVVARRSVREIGRIVTRTTVLAVLLGSLVVGIFCFWEYRRVHNRIVRPIRLLNEGAQIVGHGDLELKLKIDTQDEIEELAGSFNRMALDLKRKMHQLEDSEEKYRGLVTSMKEGIYQTNAAGEIVFLNQAAAQIFGYGTPAEALAINMNTLYVEEIDAARMDSQLRANGYVDRFRFWMTRKDGEAICVETSSSLIKNEAGDIVGVEGIFRDVTEQIRLERETKEKAGRLAVINEITNAINSSLNIDRVYEAIALQVRKLVQFDCAGIALQTETADSMEVFGLWPLAEDEPVVATTLKSHDKSGLHWVMENARILVIENEHEMSSLTDIPHVLGNNVRLCVYIPLFSKERLTGAFVLGRNNNEAFSKYDLEVLEQIAGQIGVAIENARLFKNLEKSFEEVKKAQEKLAQAHEELKTLDLMKTNLLSNVSHELRTPLVSIMGYTDMMYHEKVGALNNAQKEYLAISLRNVEKLVTLIENLLDFSRLHRGTEKLVFGIVDLVELAKSSIQVIRPVADRRNINVELKAPPDGVAVEGDKEKIAQVFDNLLSNAVKFNNNGGSVTVELRRDSADNAEVSVKDTGIGIPREALDKVFIRFYQYDSSTTRKYGGTGIGLSIAQDIVRMHGGRISVTSEVGEGSTFTFTLPLALAKEAREEKRKQALPEMRGLVQIVTRDKELVENVKTQLASEGISVMHVTDKDEAVRIAGKHLPDCVAIDAGIDGHGGKTVAERLKHDAYTNRIPIVLMKEDGHDTECPDSWIAARVPKSYRKGRLATTISYVIGLSGRRIPPPGDTILIVDDDPDVIEFLGNVLGGVGYEVACAMSGQEALDKMNEGGIGLVLLDIAMPEMDGWEVCSRIRSNPQYGNVFIYIITAKPEASISDRIESSGVDGYLIKPFRTDDIISKVGEVVRQKREIVT